MEGGGSAVEEAVLQEAGMKAEFIAHIQKHKVVPLEELAAAFGLRVPAVVARVKALEVRGGGEGATASNYD